MSDAPRWLPAHLHGAGPLRRPALVREWSAPAALERAQETVNDAYESFPRLRRRPPTLLRRLTGAAEAEGHAVADRVEAGVFRTALRVALWWLRCCWRRR